MIVRHVISEIGVQSYECQFGRHFVGITDCAVNVERSYGCDRSDPRGRYIPMLSFSRTLWKDECSAFVGGSEGIDIIESVWKPYGYDQGE